MKEFLIGKTPVKMWASDCEASAMEQVEHLCALPFVYKHLALMPDIHAGKGMPIGGVLACRDVVIPNAVGVDIGCGMCAVKTNVQASDVGEDVLRKQVMEGIRDLIPLGMAHQSEDQDESLMPQGVDISKLEVISRQYASALKQLGTLGGGNHFIELQRDQDGWMWIMIHSGSRNLGKQVGDHYNKLAQLLNERWYSSVPAELNLPFLPLRTNEFRAYWAEMVYCVSFALCNRKLMMHRIEEVLQSVIPDIAFEPMINIAHNYAAWENHFGKDVIVHRKGATRARVGEVGIIPGSQGTCSYIVEGLGNPLSFQSCSHGAGRLMSRKAACNRLNLEEEIAKLDAKHIIHALRSQHDLEEASSAYKDIDMVMSQQTDLVKILTKLEPVAVIKG